MHSNSAPAHSGTPKPASTGKPMKVRIWGRYKDRKGRVWKAVDDLKFGRWILRREDRCVIGQLRTRDIIASGMEYIGQGESEYVAA